MRVGKAALLLLSAHDAVGAPIDGLETDGTNFDETTTLPDDNSLGLNNQTTEEARGAASDIGNENKTTFEGAETNSPEEFQGGISAFGGGDSPLTTDSNSMPNEIQKTTQAFVKSAKQLPGVAALENFLTDFKQADNKWGFLATEIPKITSNLFNALKQGVENAAKNGVTQDFWAKHWGNIHGAFMNGLQAEGELGPKLEAVVRNTNAAIGAMFKELLEVNGGEEDPGPGGGGNKGDSMMSTLNSKNMDSASSNSSYGDNENRTGLSNSLESDTVIGGGVSGEEQLTAFEGNMDNEEPTQELVSSGV